MLAVEVLDRGAVGDDVAAEAEIISQPLGQPVVAARYRNAVVVVVRTHHAEQPALFDGRLERRKEDVLDFARACLRVCARLPLARALVVAVDGEVLARRRDAVVLLHPLDHLDAEARGQERVFAVNFFHAPPALVAAHVEDGRIDVRVAERARLLAGDASDLSNQLLVPGAALARLRGEAGGGVGRQSAYAFVGEIGGDAQARVLDEEALHLVHGPDVLFGIGRVDAFRAFVAPAIQVLVHVGDAGLPNLFLPLRRRQLVLQNPAVAVQSSRLTGLLLQGHLREEVFDAGAQVGLRVFVNVLPAVLVQVNPAVVIDGLPRARPYLRGQSRAEAGQQQIGRASCRERV